ncbi:MAG: Na/Pi cotransporter family protein [Burkholderiaceae bacterium]|nr:Na/Pi cotransporter family protein [Burkholderiaceae bacterium]
MPAIQTRTQSYLRMFLSVSFASFALYLLMQNTGVLTVCTGVCLFLFAMVLLEESFKILSSGVLDVFLNKVADKNWKSFIFGFSLTTLVQSSGLVSIIAVSFLSAGLITLSAGVAMILGVNLSTALTTWIVGYFGLKAKISMYSMPFIIFGVILYLNRHKRAKGCGMFLLSLGLLFLGLAWMKDGFEFFKSTIDISQYGMPGMKGLLLYTAIGFGITAITQSSHATLTMAVAALSVGQIGYENSIGISIGASLGSTVITCISSLNANIEGKKIAATHVFFKVLCGIITIVAINQYLWAIDVIAPVLGIAPDDSVYKLAIFTTLFNVTGVVLLLPLIKQLCYCLNRFMKSKDKSGEIEHAKYLNEGAIEFSHSAIETLHQETKRLMKNTSNIICRMIYIDPSDVDSDESVSKIIPQRNNMPEENFQNLYQKHFKAIYSDVIDYAVRASAAQKDAKYTTQFMDIRRANLFMAAALKDVEQVNVNMTKYGFSTNEYVKAEYSHIRRNLLRMLRLIQTMCNAKNDEEIARLKVELDKNKNKFDAISSNSLDSLIRNRLITDAMATSIMNDNALSRSIAKNLRHAADIITKSQEIDD